MVLVATQVKRRRGTTAENDAFTGAEGEIVVDTERHELRVHDGVTQGGFKIGGGSGSGRNIGDIFYTTRTDTALAGAVECNGGTYSTADYTGDGSIGELLEAGKLDYISLTDYATAISTKGWCDKIGWDGTGTTSFRVPTLTPHIIQTNNIPVVGNGMTLGLTNGTTDYGLTLYNASSAGKPFSAYSGTFGHSVGTSPSGSVGEVSSYGITTDPTKSGMIADLSETANLRVMVQLATGATDQALETCTSVLADVAGLKTDTAGIIDYVVEKQDPTSANGYTWYRKYKSGWVEQGGVNTTANDTIVTISLPITMFDNNYTVQKTCTTDNSFLLGNISFRTFAVATKTTTSFQTFANQYSTGGFNWQVSGMSAQ